MRALECEVSQIKKNTTAIIYQKNSRRRRSQKTVLAREFQFVVGKTTPPF